MRPTAPLQTQVDAELASVAPALMASYRELQARRTAAAPRAELDPMLSKSGIQLATLSECHAEHMGEYWETCDALYAGGHRLLGNEHVMRRIFPAHNAEMKSIYDERRKRAFYLNYAGKIVDVLTSGLQGDPLRLTLPDEDGEPQEIPDVWRDWTACVTAPGASLAHRFTLHGIVCEAIRRAQIKRDVWILADLPRVDQALAARAETLADQEQLGLLTMPYLCLVDADEVLNWEHDDDGQLQWVIHHACRRRRPSPTVKRGHPEHTWTIWTATGWAKYQLVADPQNPPKETDMVPLVDSGEHPFGVVPWVRFSLPDGLWTMGKLESPAREHLNKRNALSWAEFKSLFAVLYEFLARPEAQVKTVGDVTSDPNRATNQIRGQGHTQRRGKDDSAKYIGPDPGPFSEARESCSEVMQEMHRVTSTMAASADMKSAALQRSADSKEADKSDTKTVLEAFGMLGRELAPVLVALVARGAPVTVEMPPKMIATGLDTFDVQSIASRIADAVEFFAGVPVLSPTVKRTYLAQLYQAILGDAATDELMDEVREELAEAVTSEDLLLQMAAGAAGAAPRARGKAKAPAPPAGDDDEEPEKPEPGAGPAGK